MAKAKKIIRRCLLLALCGLATACSSVKQMPSTPTPDSGTFLGKTELAILPSSSSLLTNPSLQVKVEAKPENQKFSSLEDMASFIAAFKLSSKVVKDIPVIINIAEKYSYEDFPKKEDLLALMAIESRFHKDAQSNGCEGLLQIQAKSHRKKIKGRSLFNPEVNVEVGSQVLNQYYNLLGKSKRAAVLAFNSGIGNFLKGRYKQEYYDKYRKNLGILDKLALT